MAVGMFAVVCRWLPLEPLRGFGEIRFIASSLDSSLPRRRKKLSAGELKSRARPMKNGCVQGVERRTQGRGSVLSRFSAARASAT